MNLHNWMENLLIACYLMANLFFTGYQNVKTNFSYL